MKRFLSLKAGLLLLVCAPGMAIADLIGDPEAGKQKAAVCAACHGPDGNSVNPAWPKIAGQGEQYFITQVKAFQGGPEGTRKGPEAVLMYPMVAALSEQDVLDLAAYFAGQKMTPGAADDALAAKGEQVYRGGNVAVGAAACIGCHGPSGKGNAAAGYPALSGQHAQYIYSQLQAFKSGERAGDPNGMMHDLVLKMSDEEMRAAAEYAQGLY